MKQKNYLLHFARLGCLAACLTWVLPGQAEPLLNFPFDEGTGYTTTDTVHGLVGVLGTPLNPATDTVMFMDTSPSGLPGDRCITNVGNGFLLADDAAERVLEITNGPITMEAWIFIDPMTPTKAAEGIIGYGSSYKMGMRGGRQVFTLFGKVDITNTLAYVDAGRWVHLAAAWDPGVGVHFYMDGMHQFEPNANTTARPLVNTYLGIGSEGLANNVVAALDRVRIHHALLEASEIDSNAANPKPPLPSTIVAYNFNETALPCKNAIAPELPADLPHSVVNPVYSPIWTNDTPSGLSGDYALAFVRTDAPQHEFVNVSYEGYALDLGANNTSFTLQAWIKPLLNVLTNRQVILRTAGSAPRASLSLYPGRSLVTTIYGIQDFYSCVVVPNDNRWHHVAVVVEDFARVHFYLDGTLRETIERTAGANATSAGTNSLLIGKESEALFFRGLLDRVIIDNHALSMNELDFPAAPGRAIFQTQPVGRLVEAGADVQFTATVSSPTPATYQWYRRDQLTDPTGVPVPGQNTSTLTLNHVTEADAGVYSLFVTNTAGVSESYGAGLTLRPASQVVLQTGFEPPTYAPGTIAGQDSWVLSGTATNGTHVQTDTAIADYLSLMGIPGGDPVHDGSQALFAVAPGGASSQVVKPVVGIENESRVIMDVWMRGLGRGNTPAPVGNAFIALEGTDAANARATYLGFRIPHASLTNTFSIDYGHGSGGIAITTWLRSGIEMNENEWYQFTALLDYDAKTYDFFLNEEEIAKNIPFVHPNTDAFRQLRVFRGANQAGLIVDDFRVSIPAPVTAPELGIRQDGNTLVIFWPSSVTGYVLKSADAVDAPPASWTSVTHTTVGDEHRAEITPTGNSRFFRLVK